MQTGKLITFEGIDGSGKSTLSKAVYEKLLNQGFSVLLTKEPGATEFGKTLRKMLQESEVKIDPKAEFLLFAADRAQHIEQVVLPALKAGKIVISDRMADSSLAYQGYGRNLDKEIINKVNSWAMQGLKPDLTIYIKIDYETAIGRIKKRDEKLTNFEKEKTEFFQRVIQGFDEILGGSRQNASHSSSPRTEEEEFRESHSVRPEERALASVLKDRNIVILDGQKSPEALLQESLKHITNLIQKNE